MEEKLSRWKETKLLKVSINKTEMMTSGKACERICDREEYQHTEKHESGKRCVSRQSCKVLLVGGYPEWRWNSEFSIIGKSVLCMENI